MAVLPPSAPPRPPLARPSRGPPPGAQRTRPDHRLSLASPPHRAPPSAGGDRHFGRPSTAHDTHPTRLSSRSCAAPPPRLAQPSPGRAARVRHSPCQEMPRAARVATSAIHGLAPPTPRYRSPTDRPSATAWRRERSPSSELTADPSVASPPGKRHGAQPGVTCSRKARVRRGQRRLLRRTSVSVLFSCVVAEQPAGSPGDGLPYCATLRARIQALMQLVLKVAVARLCSKSAQRRRSFR